MHKRSKALAFFLNRVYILSKERIASNDHAAETLRTPCCVTPENQFKNPYNRLLRLVSATIELRISFVIESIERSSCSLPPLC